METTPTQAELWFRRIATASLLLCLIVVVLGAYVRLSDAGLGCPDWPGCYGALVVPEDPAIAAAWPERPLEADKAWKEMVHRYAASVLGLCIVVMTVLSWRIGRLRGVMLGGLALVAFQGILGMWTVTWQLKPLVVTAHLLGGMTTLGLLAWINASLWLGRRPPPRPAPRGLLLAALILLTVQIALGGWTSSNYAALACTDFPTCHGQWMPEADFAEGFVLWRGLGVNYEFGVLDSPARTAIHLAHRIGALLIGSFLIVCAILLLRSPPWRAYGGLLLAGVLLQVGIGIATVIYSLPLAVAAAHNAGAALLVLITVASNEAAWRQIPTST